MSRRTSDKKTPTKNPPALIQPTSEFWEMVKGLALLRQDIPKERRDMSAPRPNLNNNLQQQPVTPGQILNLERKRMKKARFSQEELENLRELAAIYRDTDEDVTLTADFFVRLVDNIR